MPAKCLVNGCDWDTDEPIHHVAGCLASWHVYETHPDVWREKVGDRPPVDPDPRTPEGLAIAMIEVILSAP